MRFARACAAVLASSLPCAPQMVVLGGPGRPSQMLGGWLAAHPERFVVGEWRPVRR